MVSIKKPYLQFRLMGWETYFLLLTRNKSLFTSTLPQFLTASAITPNSQDVLIYIPHECQELFILKLFQDL